MVERLAVGGVTNCQFNDADYSFECYIINRNEKLLLVPCGVMCNDHFHIFHFAKNYIPFHTLKLVVRDEMDIYLPAIVKYHHINECSIYSISHSYE